MSTGSTLLAGGGAVRDRAVPALGYALVVFLSFSLLCASLSKNCSWWKIEASLFADFALSTEACACANWGWAASAARPGCGNAPPRPCPMPHTAVILQDIVCTTELVDPTVSYCQTYTTGSDQPKQLNDSQGVAAALLFGSIALCLTDLFVLLQFARAARGGGDVDVRGGNYFGTSTKWIIARGAGVCALTFLAYAIVVGQAVDYRNNYFNPQFETDDYSETFNTVGTGAACAISAAVFSGVAAGALGAVWRAGSAGK